jgi:hypothetical protein
MKLAVPISKPWPKNAFTKCMLVAAEISVETANRMLVQVMLLGGSDNFRSFITATPQKMAEARVPSAITKVFTMSIAKYGDGQNASGARITVVMNI